jgi:hypothetical protein
VSEVLSKISFQNSCFIDVDTGVKSEKIMSGGEVAFIKRMINDGKKFGDKIK